MWTALNAWAKDVGGGWTRSSLVASFVVYVTGYLAIRFHLTALGIGTDLTVLDERYLFTGARFFLYLLTAIPLLVLVALPLTMVSWLTLRLLPVRLRTAVGTWLWHGQRLTLIGIVFAVFMIQFVMRQCFLITNLLLSPISTLQPDWLLTLMRRHQFLPLYFSLLLGSCAVSMALLWKIRESEQRRSWTFAEALLAYLVAVQLLLLPINYGVLIVDKIMPRVASLGQTPLPPGETAWLVWEGTEGSTFLVRNRNKTHRSLITVPRAEVKRTEILGFDSIVSTLLQD